MTINPNLQSSQIDKDLETAILWAREHHMKPAAWMLRGVKGYKKFVDHNLWEITHASIKLFTAQTILEKHEARAKETNQPFDREATGDMIAQYVNNAVGGQEWERYMWATPKTRQLMSLAMFAPDWTLSNLNISGLPNLLKAAGISQVPIFGKGIANLAAPKSSVELKEMAGTYWPGMFFILTALPAFVQFMIYQTCGDPEKDDDPWSINNELGKELSVDITPIARLTGFGGLKGDDRWYLKWGKQAREIKRWVEDPINALTAKSSMVVKTAFEQITGSDFSGYDKPWKDKSFLVSGPSRLIGFGDKSKLIPTTGLIGQYTPLTLKTLAQGRPPSLFAPTQKGMSESKARRAIGDVLETYADRGSWAKISGKPEYVDKLDSLVPGILDAAKRNGVDPEKVVAQAKRGLMGKYYSAYFKALNNLKEGETTSKELEESAMSAIRLHAVVKGFMGSLSSRYGVHRMNIPEGPRAITRAMVQRLEQDIGRPVSLTTEEARLIRELDQIHGGSNHVKSYIWDYTYGGFKRSR